MCWDLNFYHALCRKTISSKLFFLMFYAKVSVLHSFFGLTVNNWGSPRLNKEKTDPYRNIIHRIHLPPLQKRHYNQVCMHLSVCVCVYAFVNPCMHYAWVPVCGLLLIQSDILSRLVVTQQRSGTVLMTTPPWGFWYDPLELCLLIRVLPCPVGRGGWQDKWLSQREWHSWISPESLMWCLIRF